MSVFIENVSFAVVAPHVMNGQGASEAMAPSISSELDCQTSAQALSAEAFCKRCGARVVPTKNGQMSSRRDWFSGETANDPGLVALLYASTQAEVGTSSEMAVQGYMETVFNRAMATGKPLRQTLTNNYYPHATLSKLNSPARNPSMFERALRNVIAGSNITGFSTDNASADVASNRKKAGNDYIDIPLSSNGKNYETFYVNKNGSGSGGVPAHAIFAERAKAGGCSGPDNSSAPMNLAYNPSATGYAPPYQASTDSIGNGQSFSNQDSPIGGGGFPSSTSGGGGSSSPSSGSSAGSGGSSFPESGGVGADVANLDFENPDYQFDIGEPKASGASRTLTGEANAESDSETLGFQGEYDALQGQIKSTADEISKLESKENPSDEDLKKLDELRAKRDLQESEAKALKAKIDGVQSRTEKDSDAVSDEESKARDSGDSEDVETVEFDPTKAKEAVEQTSESQEAALADGADAEAGAIDEAASEPSSSEGGASDEGVGPTSDGDPTFD
ncbi:hypothetical protein GW915_01410 [bacterium]|nr:hypothetical protein [bacterium]